MARSCKQTLLLALVGAVAAGASAAPSMPGQARQRLMRMRAVGLAANMPLHLRGGFSVGSVVQSSPAKVDRSGSSQDLSFRSFISTQFLPRTRAPAQVQQNAGTDKDVIERTIEISATPEEVFQVATRFEQYPEWAGVTDIKVMERGRDGLGKTVKLDCGMFGRSISYTLAYSYDRPKHMRWFAIAGSLKELVGSYDFYPISGGRTRVVYKLRVEPGFYLPSVIKTSTSAFVATAALNNLKRYSELPSTKLSLQTPGKAAASPTEKAENTPIWALSTLL